MKFFFSFSFTSRLFFRAWIIIHPKLFHRLKYWVIVVSSKIDLIYRMLHKISSFFSSVPFLPKKIYFFFSLWIYAHFCKILLAYFYVFNDSFLIIIMNDTFVKEYTLINLFTLLYFELLFKLFSLNILTFFNCTMLDY